MAGEWRVLKNDLETGEIVWKTFKDEAIEAFEADIRGKHDEAEIELECFRKRLPVSQIAQYFPEDAQRTVVDALLFLNKQKMDGVADRKIPLDKYLLSLSVFPNVYFSVFDSYGCVDIARSQDANIYVKGVLTSIILSEGLFGLVEFSGKIFAPACAKGLIEMGHGMASVKVPLNLDIKLNTGDLDIALNEPALVYFDMRRCPNISLYIGENIAIERFDSFLMFYPQGAQVAEPIISVEIAGRGDFRFSYNPKTK